MNSLHLLFGLDFPFTLQQILVALSILGIISAVLLGVIRQLFPPELPKLHSPSAIVIDRATGKVLGSKDPDTRLAMASLTKIMTALLAVEYVKDKITEGQKEDDILNELVTIEQSDKDKDGEGGKGTQLALEVNTKDDPNSPIKLTLEVGDKISFGDLLYGMIRLSANDAAVAIARHVAGSREAFVKRMNERASELGLQNTSFVGASGVDPEDYVTGCKGDDFDNPLCAHYSTARDLANLTRHALSEPLFADILAVGSKKTVKSWTRKDGSSKLENTENPAWINQIGNFYYTRGGKCENQKEGVYAGKGGNTDRAKQCLVVAANCQDKDVISVALGFDYTLFNDGVKIIDFGFDSLKGV